MDTVIFDVATLHDFLSRAKAAVTSHQPAHAARISFPSPSRLLTVLSDRRLEMLCAMMGRDSMDVHELAGRVGRDVGSIQDDIAVLLDAGVVDRTEAGQLRFPYRHVKVQFSMEMDGESRASRPMTQTPPAHHAAPMSLR